MHTNPDVSTLSLEERIRRLEERFPGNGVFRGSGISRIEPEVVEDAPVDRFVPVSGGWLIKFVIPETGSVKGCELIGATLRACVFFPVIDHIVLSPSEVLLAFSINRPLAIPKEGIVIQRDYRIGDYRFYESSGLPTNKQRSNLASALIPTFYALNAVRWIVPPSNNETPVYAERPVNFRLSRGRTARDIRLYFSIGSSSGLDTPCGVGSSHSVILSSPSCLGALTTLSQRGAMVFLGGAPVSPYGYTKLKGELIDHPLKSLLPMSWR